MSDSSVIYGKISYQTFSHTHSRLYYTFQSIINISQINNTVSTAQLTAIQGVMQ